MRLPLKKISMDAELVSKNFKALWIFSFSSRVEFS